MSANPVISVVMPVYNTQDYLRECLRSLKAQRFKDFEVIFVDDGSTDGSPAILEEFASADRRASIFRQDNAGAGAARNKGLDLARGEFVIFLDSDDVFSPNLLSTALDTILGKDFGGRPADVAAFNFSQFDEFGNEKQRVGVHTDWLKTGANPFCYKDCPDCIMSIVNPTPWNKLYRRRFLLEASLRFDEISSTDDIAFAAMSVASAESVAYTTKSLLRYRIGVERTDSTRWRMPRELRNVVFAVESASSQASRLPYADEIEHSIRRFAIDNYLNVMNRFELDFYSSNVEEYYGHLHRLFNSPGYAELGFSDFSEYPHLYQGFDAVRRHPIEEMRKLRSRRLVVSATSHPARIGCVATALASILEQDRRADLVVLYLASCQFPGGTGDLPDDLTGMVERGAVELRWCDEDLGPHKKYLYSLREFEDDVVVTVDDDLLYHRSLLENLWASYLQFPHAVSAARAHLITRADNGEPLPYGEWLRAVERPLHAPSMQLIATGAGGILYPPHSIADAFLDESLIRELCPYADDLWLKAAEMVSGTPIVLATECLGLRYIEGSQDSALWRVNLDGGENDRQLARIREWLGQTYGTDVFAETLREHRGDIDGMRGAELYLRICQDRIEKLEGELRRVRSEKSQADAKLRQAQTMKGICSTVVRKFKAKGRKLKRGLWGAIARKPDVPRAE